MTVPKTEPEILSPLSKEDKFKAIKEVENTLNKQFDTKASIVRLGSKVGVPIPSIPTGLPTFDADTIECGGIPRGRIVEIFGPESSGKTTLALHVIGEEQRNTENLCAFVDAEHALDPTYAAKLGVNVNDLLVSQPDSGEQALETVDALVRSRAVSVIVVDSVSALVPQAELDGEMGDAHIGLQARLMSQAMRKLNGNAAKYGVTIIFINQIRERVGVMFGSPETTSGGRALKFYASVRLDVRKLSGEANPPIKSGDVIIGHWMKIKAVKNKVGRPFRETRVALYYGQGFDKNSDTLDYLDKSGALRQSGAWYYLYVTRQVLEDGKTIDTTLEEKFQGKKQLREALQDDPYVLKAILKLAEEAKVAQATADNS